LWGRGGMRHTVGSLACRSKDLGWCIYEDKILLEVEERHCDVLLWIEWFDVNGERFGDETVSRQDAGSLLVLKKDVSGPISFTLIPTCSKRTSLLITRHGHATFPPRQLCQRCGYRSAH
jgi:hypothetical protein